MPNQMKNSASRQKKRINADNAKTRINLKSNNVRASKARLFALDVVSECRTREAFAHDLIDSKIDSAKMSPEDKAFAARLALGVVQMRGSLDFILNRCMDKPGDASPSVRDALCLSTYEIIYLDKDVYAAIDQGVELVKSIAPKAAGFANAILRRVAKVKDTFPFGDPCADIRAFALKEGFPIWLMETLCKDLGLEAARQFAIASNEPAPIFIATNSIKTNAKNVEQLLSDSGAEPQAVQIMGKNVEGCFLLGNRRALSDGRVAKALNDSLIFVADASAQFIAQHAIEVALKFSDSKFEKLSFLELCAGRGTKTLLLQNGFFRACDSQLNDYILLDNLQYKVDISKNRAKEFGINVKNAICGDAANLEKIFTDKRFDCVFLDSPCTGLGTLRRHPEIRWRLTQDKITEAAQLDLRLLNSAASVVAAGGCLIYATCTVTVAEDTSVVSKFLKSDVGSKFRLLPFGEAPVYKPNLSQGAPDAHFCAVLKKIG